MRVCVVYDCLYPYTVGGAERWYRNLAEALAADGHDVTYLTLRQWEDDETVAIAGVEVIVVGPRMDLYVGGRRAIAPPLRFGWGVLAYLARSGRRFDVVHTASFPYFSLLAAAVVRPLGRYELSTDWFEVWSAQYWREYLGGVAGWVGRTVQRLCARVPQRAFCFSQLHARRLRDEGLRGSPTVLRGIYGGPLELEKPLTRELCVVFAGRMIPEKRAPAVVDAAALAAQRIPGLRAAIFGDGPERAAVLDRIGRLEPELARAITAHGFVDADTVHAALRSALCMLLPSSREGYGLIVVEAAACGTPSIVVAGPDNAAVELIEDGVNGVVAPAADADSLAQAIERIHDGGDAMRASTRDWFARNARELSLRNSLEVVLASYSSARR